MSNEGNKHDGRDRPDGVTRFGDVIEHDGHAWVLAHDGAAWFYECLKCNDWVHVVTIPEMNKAIEHGYAHMPLRHRAPWNQGKPVRVHRGQAEPVLKQRAPYPPCMAADAPVPADVELRRGPVVAM